MPTFTGTPGVDIFTAPTDEDWLLLGLGGADMLTGAGGNDIFEGAAGSDMLDGQGGDDIFRVSTLGGFDSYAGGEGFDEIQAVTDNVKIGIAALSGVESITANGFDNVTIIGGSGNDVLDFSLITLTGIAAIVGGGGNDTIIGTPGPDTIDGGPGSDLLLSGGAGDDIFLVGTGGIDTIDGGDDFDTLVAAGNNVKIRWASLSGVEAISSGGFFNISIHGTADNDILDFRKIELDDIALIDGDAGDDTILGTANDDIIRGGSGNDIIKGFDGADTIYGEMGDDRLDGGKGDDSFYVSGGNDMYNGGSGYDAIYAGGNGATLHVTKGSLNSIQEISANGFIGMTIAGFTDQDNSFDLRPILLSEGDIVEINTGNMNDSVFGSNVADVLNGQNGDDVLSGVAGDDIVSGGIGNDIVDGGKGFDEVNGGGGDDIVSGGAEDDFVNGDSGDDILLASANGGWDTFDGGTGIDMIQADKGVSVIQILTFANVEAFASNGIKAATIQGGFDDDVFDFSAVTFTDIAAINGGLGADMIIGTAAGDTIKGGKGDDSDDLNGGGGDDILIGELGFDTLTGGLGADIFRGTGLQLDGDAITDFELGDRIEFTNLAKPENLVFTYAAGVLTISGVGISNPYDIALAGDFESADFQAVSNGSGGSFIELIA